MIASLSASSFLGVRIADQNQRLSSRVPSRSLKIRAHMPAAEIPSTTARADASLYDVLGLHVGATSADVKKAYRSLARTCHPDVLGGDSASEEFMRVHAAYSTLSDPERRAEYDRTVMIRRRVGPAFSATRRTWETDQCW